MKDEISAAMQMQTEQEDELLIERNLPFAPEQQVVNSDDKLLHDSDRVCLSVHNSQYTELLMAYVENFKTTATEKQKAKKEMFKIAKGLLLVIPIAIIGIIVLALIGIIWNKVEALQILPELVMAGVTLVGTYIVIPNMITGYLFNEKEEEHLADIIGKIQDYDKDIRGRL